LIQNEILHLFIWFLTLEFFSALSLQLSVRLGFYSISKPISLILFSLLLWYLGRVEFSISIILPSLFLITLLNLIVSKEMKFEMKRFLEIELIFAISFLFFSFLRALSPEILFTGGEKFMEFALLKGLLVSKNLPLEDVWFGGSEMNYYYLGYLMFASLVKLTGTPPEIAFNLASATIPAITIPMAYEFGKEFSRRKSGALTLLYLLSFAGTFKISWNYWDFSRVIPNTINEFPAFSFIHADLHPHMISIPFQILTIMLIYRIYKKRSFEAFLLVLLLLNSFLSLNTWEFPTYFLLTFFVLLISKEFRKIPLLSLPIIFFLPFRTSFFDRSIGIVHETTQLNHYLLLYGLFIAIFYLRFYKNFRKSDWWLIPLFLLLFFSNYQVPALLIPLFVAIRREKMSLENLLVLLGIFLSIFVEILYVNDAFGEPYERMNTVFKLGLQNWILWSVPAGKFLSSIGRKELKLLLPMLVLSSVFLPVAIADKAHHFEELTLDGLKYLKESHPRDIEAISFLSSKERGVILELYGDSYTYSSQFSTLTGYPSVLGWRGHEIMWRGFEPVEERQKDIIRMYHGDLKLMKKYSVKYLVVSDRERALFGDIQFNLPVIYENSEVKIYEVV